MSIKESLKIRPYARLITMLGDQLIKDETIALIELVKNSYDADAEHVKISFIDFNDDYSSNQNSAIIIEDDGNGMNDIILKEAWMNPATPEKLKRKRINSSTNKGRIMQGEKGIGRFAVFKLGRKIDIVTRRQKQENGHFVQEAESEKEFILSYDFSKFDPDFLSEENEEKAIFLDDLSVSLEERDAVEIVPSLVNYGGGKEKRKPYGTKIIITNLNSTWNKSKIDKVSQNLRRMQPIFGEYFAPDFSVYIEVNEDLYLSKGKDIEELRQMLDHKAVFTVSGTFDAEKSLIEYSIENDSKSNSFQFSLSSPEMLGISPMRNYLNSLNTRKVECGPFSYKFYIFDLNISTKRGDSRYYLDKEEKECIKAHRVYLYRDGIRVMPYGDPEDDWLKLDMIRGVESAGSIMGNDQLVGYITITQKDNPNLRDKTNREGLIEEGYAKEDLVNICQLILRYIRTKDYTRYLVEKEKKYKGNEDLRKPSVLLTNARKEGIGKKAIDKVLSNIGDVRVSDIPREKIEEGNKYVENFLNDFEEAYRKEVDVMENRISTTENLAAIGLSAETAYHDARIILQEADTALGRLIQVFVEQSNEYLVREDVVKRLRPIKKQTSTAVTLMNNIQRLFPSTKTKKREISVQSVVTMVKSLYEKSLESANINCIIQLTEQDIMMECTDAVLLQVFINLFDNSLYWLKTVKTSRNIVVSFNAIERTVIFSDSGPGVRPDDAPYIFEPFFSGKGDKGKGLGLYIARQLLHRYNSSIELLSDNRKFLSGANFLLTFGNEVS